MRKVLKWVGIALGGLLGVIVVAGIVLNFVGASRADRSYDLQVSAVKVPDDPASIERGRFVVEAMAGCTSCHGDDLAGELLFEVPGVVTMYTPNLTSGRGGIGATYGDQDWVRAIRRGVNRDGDGLWFMLSEVFHNMTAEDLGAVIAFVKTVPPVDNESPARSATPLANILVAIGLFGEIVPAQLIDHDAPIRDSIAPAITAEYGQYLASIRHCLICHGEDLTGGVHPDPEAQKPPNITTGGRTSGYSETDFIRLLRSGTTPDNRVIDPDLMPWDMFYTNWTDDELRAVWEFVNSVPGVAS